MARVHGVWDPLHLSGDEEADAQSGGTRDEWTVSVSPRRFHGGEGPMEVARGVLGVAITFGAVVILLTLLNWRDRRASRLRHTVLDQLALPELRGRVGVHIQCAVFSWRRAVIVDLLAGTPHEVWTIFTRMASRLPPRVRLVVHGAPDAGFTRLFMLETTTGRLPSHMPRTSLVTN
jgi:hypothetical protein